MIRITKDSEPMAVLDAVRKVVGGGRAVSAKLAEKLLFDNGGSMEEAPVQRLSEREYEIFLRLVKGERLSDIAEALHLSTFFQPSIRRSA